MVATPTRGRPADRDARTGVRPSGAGQAQGRRTTLATATRYAAVFVGAVLVWFLASWWVANPVVLPSPGSVWKALVGLVADGTLWGASRTSLTRLLLGYGIAAVICLPLGIAMGLSQTIRAFFDPIVEMLRPISGIAWIPLALLLFGIGAKLVVFIIFYGAAFPMIINAAAGVRQVDPHLRAAAKTFGANRLTILLHVILPGALPTILVGLRVASGTAWMSLVAAELVGSSSGLGYSLDYFRQLLMSNRMIACIVVIGLLGTLTNGVLRSLEMWLTPWAPKESR